MYKRTTANIEAEVVHEKPLKPLNFITDRFNAVVLLWFSVTCFAAGVVPCGNPKKRAVYHP